MPAGAPAPPATDVATADMSGAPPPPPPAPVVAMAPASSLAAGAAAASPSMERSKAADGAATKSTTEADEPKTWRRSQLGAQSMRVRVGDHEELSIRAMQASVTIDGTRARVVLDAIVKNDRGGNYEGTFQLRLPDGASPYFFAFGEQVQAIAEKTGGIVAASESRRMGSEPDAILAGRQALWREPKEARMVPRETAALAYRDTVRRQVDPALVEWSGPGIWSARVFPLTAGRSHRIVLGYDVPLQRVGADFEYAFDLPPGVPTRVVDMRVQEPAAAVVEARPAVQVASVDGARWVRFEEANAPSVAVRVRAPGATHLEDPNGAFFAADLALDAPTAGSAPAPSDAALFLLDTSLSSNPDRFNVWLALLESILRNNRGTLRRFNVEYFGIDQRFFRPTFVANDDAGVAAVLDQARSLVLEGATDVGAALRHAAHPPVAAGDPRSWDVFLLSDGASTWGESDPRVFARAVSNSGIHALYAYETGLAGTDTDTLAELTRDLGGAAFSVTGDQEVAAASVAHRARPYRLLSAKVPGVTDLLLAGRPRFLFPGQALHVVGRGQPAPSAKLELTLDVDGVSRVVALPLGAPIPSPLAARVYGQVAVGQLEELGPATLALAPAYARAFRVSGKTCSLLMLERESDYERFGIHAEDDTRVARGTEVSQVVAEALAREADRLGDPKRAFLDWVHELPRRSGVTFSFPAGFDDALARIPAETFDVAAPPLDVRITDRAWVPSGVLAALASHSLDYDVISAEAERRRGAAGAGDALKALSSLVEENPGDAVLGRDVGLSALTWGLPGQAFHLFRRVGDARPFEPQTYRAEAESLVRMGNVDLALALYEVGLAGQWSDRFGDFRQIAAVEYLELLEKIASGEAKSHIKDFALARLSAVAPLAPVDQADLVVMITWNTDGTDVDLHVTEPDGDHCFYGHRTTRSGGQLTRDVTQGYGPEMYVMRHAAAGRYRIQAHYFASDRNRASARTKVQARVYEDFGRPQQRVTEKTVVLEYGKEMHDLLDVVRKGSTGNVAKSEMAIAK
jgi:hypothetical protein